MGKCMGVSIVTYTAAGRVPCTLLLIEIDMSACVYSVHACMSACVCTLTHCGHTTCVCTFLYVSLHFPSYWDRVSLCCASCRLTHKHWGILFTSFYLTESTGACLPWCMALHKFWRGADDCQVLVLMQQVFFFANLANLTVHQILYLVNVNFLIIF